MSIWLGIERNLPPEDDLPNQAVAILDSEIHRLDSVVKRFLDFTTVPELHWEEAPARRSAQRNASIARPQMDQVLMRLQTSYQPVPPVRVDRPAQAGRLNLAFNAIEAMLPSVAPSASASAARRIRRNRISDTGSGIAPEHRARIFQLFFTTRRGGRASV